MAIYSTAILWLSLVSNDYKIVSISEHSDCEILSLPFYSAGLREFWIIQDILLIESSLEIILPSDSGLYYEFE